MSPRQGLEARRCSSPSTTSKGVFHETLVAMAEARTSRVSRSIRRGKRLISPSVCRSAHRSASAWEGIAPASTREGSVAFQSMRAGVMSQSRTHKATAVWMAEGGWSRNRPRRSTASRAVHPRTSSRASRSPPDAADEQAASRSQMPSGEATEFRSCCSSTAGHTRRPKASMSAAKGVSDLAGVVATTTVSQPTQGRRSLTSGDPSTGLRLELRPPGGGQVSPSVPGGLLGLGSQLDGHVLELVEGRVDTNQGELLFHHLEVELPYLGEDALHPARGVVPPLAWGAGAVKASPAPPPAPPGCRPSLVSRLPCGDR